MNRTRTLLIRADASSEIGVGHVMRCLALAQAWQDAGGRALFSAAQISAALRDRLGREQCEFMPIDGLIGSPADAMQTAALARAQQAEWIVVDGYRFGPEYGGTLRATGCRLLALDDMGHLDRYPVDLLLNQNLSATAELYLGKTEARTRLLLGPRFALLRREFRATIPIDAGSKRARRRLLVTFGGGDSENYTGRILLNLAAGDARGLEVVVLAGAANPHADKLRRFAATAPFACEVRVAEENVAAVMAEVDVAISAAGSTLWELAAMRLPALIGAYEENQLAGLAALRRISAFRAWTVEELLDRDIAAELKTLPRFPATAEYDADGASRVVDEMQTLFVHSGRDLIVA